MLLVHLTKELEDRLTKLSDATQQSKSHHVKEALEKYLENLEDSSPSEQAQEERRREDDTISKEMLEKNKVKSS